MFYNERASYNGSNYIIGKQTEQMRWRVSTWRKKYKWQKIALESIFKTNNNKRHENEN